MSAYRKFLAIATVFAASGTAAAQSPGGESPPAEAEQGGGSSWRHYPNERHIIVRGMFGAGLRFNDAWGAGPLAPPYFLAQGGFLFVNAGPLSMGPTLGVQLGLDLGHSGTQVTVQPGWSALWRLSSLLALTGRVEIPVLFTSGRCEPFPIPAARRSVNAPITGCTEVGFGAELGVGAAVYLTSGVALTGEVNFDVYFGNAFFPYPVLGAGLGVLVDYEVLP